MALDARRRQKKAEKRKAKEKAKRKELAHRKADDLGGRIARAAAAPILQCCTQQGLWDSGMAQLLISRELASGQVVFAAFLIDRYCLGVKDAFCNFAARSEYFERLYDPFSKRGELVSLKPAAARKLIEGAVEYAKSLGLSPHPDYARARNILGDINAADSDREFEFGYKGQPHFIAGPHDTPGRIASIMGILTERFGPEGFHYTVPVGPGALPNDGVLSFGGEEDEDDLDEGDFADDDEADEGDVIAGTVGTESQPVKRPLWRLPHFGFGRSTDR